MIEHFSFRSSIFFDELETNVSNDINKYEFVLKSCWTIEWSLFFSKHSIRRVFVWFKFGYYLR